MKEIQNLLLLSLLLSICTTACHKHEHPQDEDKTAPVITISAPTADVSIAGAVSLTGTVSDEGLHEMSMVVIKDSDNSVLFTTKPAVFNLTAYTFAETWTPSAVVVETSVTLTVIAEDHSSNKATATVKFKVKP